MTGPVVATAALLLALLVVVVVLVVVGRLVVRLRRNAEALADAAPGLRVAGARWRATATDAQAIRSRLDGSAVAGADTDPGPAGS